MKGLFITGSDTNVGKTYTSCQIAATLSAAKINVIPRKPVETGCELINDQLFPHDASLLLAASQANISLDAVNPYRFVPAVSPQIAARLDGNELNLQQLISCCTDGVHDDDFLLVEGAGGFLSPICELQLNADLAQALGLPVLLVVSDRLGSVNQTLLAINAIEQYQLQISAIILNQTMPHHNSMPDSNLQEITDFTHHRVYHNLYNQGISSVLTDQIILTHNTAFNLQINN